MKWYNSFFIILLLGGCSIQSENITKNTYERPNIIIMLVDDMGFSDPGCYGGEIRTPNLDKLAGQGIRFTQFYNTSRCCPTRASLLTGLYQHQAGIGQMTGDKGFPGYSGKLRENTVTIAELLGGAGYNTGMVGKWHVSRTKQQQGKENQLKWLNHQGYENEDFSTLDSYPTKKGFEKFYGNIWGVVNYFDPFSLVNGDQPVKKVPANYYHTTALSDSAVAYIDEFSKDESPFFLYIAHTAPHWPLHALPEDIEKYEATYQKGWDAIREARYNKMVDLGIVDPVTTPLSPEMREVKDWESNPNKVYDARKMAVHAAMIDRIDQGLGKIISKLKEKNQLDNTVILFLSDNGASPETPGEGGFDRNSETRDGKQVIYTTHDKSVMPGPETTYAGIGREWANVANTPFRFWKAKTFEGGITTPLIAHWPKGITSQAGTTNHSPGHVIDLMATCLDLAKIPYPDQFNNKKVTPLEGKSLMPIFKSGSREGHKTIFFEHYWSKALRAGKWKIVALPNDEWELYNLEEDRTELNNLANELPDKVTELSQLWEEEALRLDVFPQPEMPERLKKNRENN
ncbi:arylsulfatase [Fulvivirgaceae bacterium BMA12]|uniref:Arylsulfatase n=1 Tax=Agaribacillus aureus TaxID=3051825 RepID=A0ABT8L1R1_9BACT|nr:arylsulfatase [Fulvivirgaceae bacterium BMA12]